MNEVRNLLVKLGELPPPSGNNQNIRVINADLNPETFRYLKGLERQWQQVSPNPLLLPAEDRFKDQLAPDDTKRKGSTDTETDTDTETETETETPHDSDQTQANDLPLKTAPPQMDHDTVSSHRDTQQWTALLAQNASDADQSLASEPIRFEIDAAGNLVISSRDTAALDRLEDLMLQFAPPRRAYHTFITKYTSANWVKLNLEDFFKDEDDKKNDSNSFSRWYFGFDDQEDNKQGPSGLGRSAKLRFLADIDTGTIVVSNASAEQLKTIEELIRLWDVPEPVNNRRVRYTRLVSIGYGRAGKIAETIKETYRDLLSSNDKAFQQPGQAAQGGGNQVQKANAANVRSGGSELVDMGGSGQQGGGADFSFKGKLSLGIDELGNTLLVSAEGEELLKLVCDMIDQLDKAARASDGVRVMNMPASVNAGALEMALRTLQSGTQQSASSPASGIQRGNSPGSPAEKGSANGRRQSSTVVEATDG